MSLKIGILRALVFDIYRRETKEPTARWEDLDLSLANVNTSLILHKSTIAKKKSVQALHELRHSMNKQMLENTIHENDEEEPFEDL